MLSRIHSTFSLPKVTAANDTAFTAFVPPKIGVIARITALAFTSAGTALTLTVLKALGLANVTTAAAAGDTTLIVDATTFGAAQTIAANDYIAVRLASGEWFHTLVSANSSGTLTVSALPEAVSAGAQVQIFGAAGDTGHLVLAPPVSLTSSYQSGADGAIADSGYNFVSSAVRYKKAGQGRGMIVHCNNVTAAGTLHYVSGNYAIN